MWTIALFVGDGGARQINLVYRGEAAARAAWAELTREVVEDPIGELVVRDDFGTEAAVYRDVVVGKVLQDAAGAAEAGVELGLLQARSQSKMQRRAQADPMLNGRVVSPPYLGPQ